MSLAENVQQGMRSLALHRLRTLLSTLGILFGVVSVVAMLSIGEGAKQETLSQIEQLGMNTITIRQNEMAEEQLLKAREQRSKGLTESDAIDLRHNVPFVQYQAALKVVETTVNTALASLSPEILAVTETFDEIKGLGIAEGRFLGSLDILQRKQVCVLGCDVSKNLGKYGHVGQAIRIDNVEFQIVGILKNKNWKAGKTTVLTTRNLNKSVFIPLGADMSLPNIKQTAKQGALSEIILQISHSSKMPQATNVIKHIMKMNHGNVDDYQVIIPQELLDQAYRTQYTFNLVLGSIAAISLLVGGIGIMNIMLATVSERTREIGIRRAVGANKFHIVCQFLTEALLLTFIGAILGVVIGLCFSFLISYLAGWTTVVTLWSVLLSLGMAGFVGCCSGLYPAIKAASMNPIKALRHD
jgi:putative ABC transport system permease protein